MKFSIKSYIRFYMKSFNSLQKLIYFMGIDGFRGSGQWKTQKPFENVVFSHFWAMKLIKKLQNVVFRLRFGFSTDLGNFEKRRSQDHMRDVWTPLGSKNGSFLIYFMAANRVKQSVSLHFDENGVRNAISKKLIRTFCMKSFNSLRQNGHPWN